MIPLHSPRRGSARSYLKWSFGPGGCVVRPTTYVKIFPPGCATGAGRRRASMSSSRHPLVAPAAMPGALNQNEDGDVRHGTRLDRKISLRSRNAMNDDALNGGCRNSQNMVTTMSVRESHLHEPESCICPMCKRV